MLRSEQVAQQKKAERRKLAIATAPQRFSKKWKNKEISWPDLLEKLKTPTRTPETFREYQASSKPVKGKIKDVGGFVAGVLSDGRRISGAVAWRSMVTLDIDNAQGNVWSTVELALENTACLVYSTHSHSTAKPRLRLIIPLSRNVTADEYEPLARRIAADVGINLMDKTTYQSERLMFWPSASSDGVYQFNAQDGEFLDPDEVLNRYADWRDSYQWPTADDEQARLRNAAKKQGDPLAKKGFIGAFNRAYRIEDVIEKWLSDEYEPYKGGRYTFLGGSTVGGLIIYQEGLFAYSHHGTSPTSGQLTNAFDFLRLHLFHEDDLDTDPQMPANRKPSYLNMIELLNDDKPTKAELIDISELPFDVIDDEPDKADKNENIADLFDYIGDEEDADFWEVEKPDDIGEKVDRDELKKFLGSLERTEKGDVRSTGANVRLILGFDPNLKNKIAMDEFNKRLVVTGRLPWERLAVEDWSDTDDGSLCTYIEHHYGIAGEKKITNALNEVAINNRFHPVRDYINSLEWDGKPRIETMLQEYFGAADTDYTKTVAKIHMAAAVARIFKAGTKYDTALVLIGGQGLGKSLFISKLSKGWGNDSLQQVDNKDAYESLQGSWLVELPEMSAMKRTDNETIKHFLSKQEDKFRPSYGRRTVTYKRECVFWGTSNDGLFLKDTTGNRRFFPVQCYEGQNSKTSWNDLKDDEINQLWAEAYELYTGGLSLYLTLEMDNKANEIRETFTEQSPLKPTIDVYLSMPLPLDWYDRHPNDRAQYFKDYLAGIEDDQPKMNRERVSASEVWREALDHSTNDYMKRIESREINDIIAASGWTKAPNVYRVNHYGAVRGFTKGAN